MDQFTKEDFESLSKVRDLFCVSIFLPTHTAGMEVNKSMDRISFKNKVQAIKEELESLGHNNITKLLEPAYLLIDDISFWKEQSNGLAVFLNSNMFKVFRLPITFPDFSLVSSMFELPHLLPMLTSDDIFFTLSLSQKNVRLFRNNSFSYQELNVSHLVPENIEKILEYYEFNKHYDGGKQPHIGAQTGPGGGSHFKTNEGVNASSPADRYYKYVEEFLMNVDKGLGEILKHETSPLVVASTESLFGEYKKIQSYRFIEQEAVYGNPDHMAEREMHESAFRIVSNKLYKARKKALEKYPVWVGTGKASYDLPDIIASAFGGRVESLFLLAGTYVWGNYNEATRKIVIHDNYQPGDINLLGIAVTKTIENSGNAYIVKKEEMPEKTVNTLIAATYRY